MNTPVRAFPRLGAIPSPKGSTLVTVPAITKAEAWSASLVSSFLALFASSSWFLFLLLLLLPVVIFLFALRLHQRKLLFSVRRLGARVSGRSDHRLWHAAAVKWSRMCALGWALKYPRRLTMTLVMSLLHHLKRSHEW